jgi:mannose-1-phosphate guanylyltransferase/mannose-6-phosphate isomerase
VRRPLAALPRSRVHAVVLAGGAGERFWPLSRARRPKPLLDLGDRRALLAETVARARRFAGAVWVVCGPEHARDVIRVTRLPRRRVLVEPRRRNTAPAIGFAAARIAAEAPDAVLVVLPADHRIPDADAFARAARRAADAAARAGALVTLGVRPTRPETAYGWIECGPPAGRGLMGLHRARRFVEKPSEARARRLLRRGGVLWNAGIFAWEARTILEEIERCAPRVHRALGPVLRRPRGRGAPAAARRAFARAPAVSIDHAVLERSRRVLVLPVSFRWSDVGTWASLADALGVRPGRNRILAGELVACDAGGNLVRGDGRLVALVGVRDLAVIDSGDALLVARLDRSGDVRRVVKRLRARGRLDLV